MGLVFTLFLGGRAAARPALAPRRTLLKGPKGQVPRIDDRQTGGLK